jgi:cell fate regulator YaaT (PSP1 superfamily)
MCGRLLCCLAYEYRLYKDINDRMPKLGTEIRSGDATYIITGVDTLKETILMRHGGRTLEIKNTDIELQNGAYVVRKDVATRIDNANDQEEDAYIL